ncbi:DNA-3-methyladenine glycosylase [bacterium HR23]|nr:DNA-3-methyladenine glycosylase [bacterium HR23]
MAQGLTCIRVPLDTPLDLEATLFSGQDFRWDREGDGYVGWLGDAPVLLQRAPSGLVALTSLPEGEAHARLRRFLRLDDDLDAIRTALAGDGVLARCMASWPGLRLVRLEPWPALAFFLCSQHAPIPRITRMLNALAQALGEPVVFLGRERWRFPTPTAIAGAGPERLAALRLGYRAEYLWRTACLLAQGRAHLDVLASLPTEEARRRLLALPGVGEKVADCVLLLGFGRTDAFPVDRWVRRALVEWYGLPPPYTERRLRAWAQERWGSLAGYAQLYLFHHRRTVHLLQ